MAAEAMTSDWVRDERRKQNAVVLAVVLACLLVAFFPRTERWLFAFPTQSSITAVAGPIPAQLKSAIFGSPAPAAKRLPVVPAPQPVAAPVFDDPAPLLLDDPWRDSLLVDRPLELGRMDLPGLAKLVGPQTPRTPPGPRTFGDGGQYYIAGVPEPGTWAMMILGIGAIAYRLRAVRRRALRQRVHERWRRSLVPSASAGVGVGPASILAFSPAMPACSPPARDGMPSLIGPWSAPRCRNVGGFGPGADHLAHRLAPAREQQRH